MYDSCENVVARMEAGKRPKKNTPYRGLEVFLNSNSIQMEETIHDCIDAVMDEQDRQWNKTDYIDWDLFRKVSLEISTLSVSLARNMAIYDEKEANNVYIELSKECHQTKDDTSVSTDITETSKSTMAHEIYSKYYKASKAEMAKPPSCRPTEESKNSTVAKAA